MLPLKPKVVKRFGGWFVLVPDIVFGKDFVGTYHGPFPTWMHAVAGALAMVNAVHRNLQAMNQTITATRGMS